MIKSLYPQFQRWSATGSIYLISDTHFDDDDCKLMNPSWITPEEHIKKIKEEVHKNDTLIHLGDVGNADYLDELKCYKVLITGNHDILSKVANHFDEVYTGPLFIADRILLSHEPIYGLEKFALNLHGHEHNGVMVTYFTENEKMRVSHVNFAADVAQWEPCSLATIIKLGFLSDIPNYHRITIDRATEKKNGNNIYNNLIGGIKDMEIYMDIDWVRGRINYGHLEGEVNFSKEEEKDFQTLLAKDLNDEELTEEENDRLEKYKETIIDRSHFVIDDYEIDDFGEYEWRDLLY